MKKQETMQAVIFEGNEIKIVTRDIPHPKDDEVLIKVSAIGVNRADILQRLGHYTPPSGESDIPGLEISGTIVKENRRVCAIVASGAYAEYVIAKRALCFDIPIDMDMNTAACLPEALFTVTKNIFVLGNLQTNEHLLIHGGASGIGTIAIQMARAIGARVTVTAGSNEKCEFCTRIGANMAINYKLDDFTSPLKNDKVDVVLDMAGGDVLSRDLTIMNKHGRHISIAYLNGRNANIDIATVMRNHLTVTGSTLRHDSTDEKIKLAQIISARFWPLVINGTIKPIIDKTFTFNNAKDAHEYFERGVHMGKVIITV